MPRRVRDVLTVERFIEMRTRGCSYAVIGLEIGFKWDAVARFGRKVLPEELRGHRARVRVRARAKGKRRCHRCGFLEEPQNPLNEDGLCLYCQLILVHVDLREWHQEGEAMAVLEKSYADHLQAIGAGNGLVED